MLKVQAKKRQSFNGRVCLNTAFNLAHPLQVRITQTSTEQLRKSAEQHASSRLHGAILFAIVIGNPVRDLNAYRLFLLTCMLRDFIHGPFANASNLPTRFKTRRDGSAMTKP